MLTPKLGVRMSADDAKAYIDAVNQKVVRRWRERVTEGAFMSKFLDGTLPMPAIMRASVGVISGRKATARSPLSEKL